MIEKCWSVNGEDFFDDWCQLLDELEQEELGEGTEYFEGDKVDVEIMDPNAVLNLVGQLEIDILAKEVRKRLERVLKAL